MQLDEDNQHRRTLSEGLRQPAKEKVTVDDTRGGEGGRISMHYRNGVKGLISHRFLCHGCRKADSECAMSWTFDACGTAVAYLGSRTPLSSGTVALRVVIHGTLYLGYDERIRSARTSLTDRNTLYCSNNGYMITAAEFGMSRFYRFLRIHTNLLKPSYFDILVGLCNDQAEDNGKALINECQRPTTMRHLHEPERGHCPSVLCPKFGKLLTV